MVCLTNEQWSFCHFWESGLEGKVSACNVGDWDSIPELGRFPGEGNGNPLQYSCTENPMDRGALKAEVHGVAKSQTRLSNFTSAFWTLVDYDGYSISSSWFLPTVVDIMVIWVKLPIQPIIVHWFLKCWCLHLLFDHFQFALIHGPNISGSYAILLFTALFKELSKVFSINTVQKHQFFGTKPSLLSNSHICMWQLQKL